MQITAAIKGVLSKNVVSVIQNCHKKSPKIKKISLRNTSEGVHC